MYFTIKINIDNKNTMITKWNIRRGNTVERAVGWEVWSWGESNFGNADGVYMFVVLFIYLFTSIIYFKFTLFPVF